jgi:hypothetical protein
VPNAGRNLGLRHVRTRYVVFIDNDAVPSPGWLPPLVECAETTGAWVVGPLYFVGEPEAQEIHMAAGDARMKDRPGGRRFIERHRFVGKRPSEVRVHLVREPCEQVEFHCMLVRMEVFERLGPLDERLKSVAEHIDLCLLVRTTPSSSAAGAAPGPSPLSSTSARSGSFRPARPGWPQSRSGPRSTGTYRCAQRWASSSNGSARGGGTGPCANCSAWSDS